MHVCVRVQFNIGLYFDTLYVTYFDYKRNERENVIMYQSANRSELINWVFVCYFEINYVMILQFEAIFENNQFELSLIINPN